MKPRRIASSNTVLSLAGGNEDNDLWLERMQVDGQWMLVSTWQPSEAERHLIAEGGTIDLTVWGAGHPPVKITVGPPLEQRKEK